jgi:hypothetical protein
MGVGLMGNVGNYYMLRKKKKEFGAQFIRHSIDGCLIYAVATTVYKGRKAT